MKKVSIGVPQFSFHSFIIYPKAQYDDEKKSWKPKYENLGPSYGVDSQLE